MLKSNIIYDRLEAEIRVGTLEESSTDEFYIKEINRMLSLNKPKPEDILREFGSTVYTANSYLNNAVRILKESNFDPNLMSIFETTILPKISNKVFKNVFEPNTMVIIESWNKDFFNLILKNHNAIRIVDNYKRLLENSKVIDKNFNIGEKTNIWKLCNEVSTYGLSTTGSVIISIEEANQFNESKGVEMNDIIDSIMEFFSYTTNDMDIKALNEFFLSPNTISLNGTSDVALPKKYPLAVEYSSDSLSTLDNAAPVIEDIFNNMYRLSGRFKVFINCLVLGFTRRKIDQAILPELFEMIKDAYDRFLRKIDSKIPNLIDDIINSLVYGINLCDSTIANNQNMDNGYIHSFIALKDSLNDLLCYVRDSLDYKYDIENEAAIAIMDESFKDIITNITSAVSNAFIGDNGIFTKFKNLVTDKLNLRKFKNYKAKNLITMTLGIDKQIRDRMEGYRKHGLKGIFGKMKKFIFKEDMEITNEVLCEMVNSSGIVNISVGAYEMSSPIDKIDLAFFSEITKEINSTLTEGIVYYICNENQVEFLYRDFSTEVDLTTEEVTMMESYFPEYDRRLVSWIGAHSVLENIDVSTIIEVLSNASSEEFKTVLELFSIMGVDKEVVKEIYSGIEENRDKDTLRAFREDCNMDTILYESNPMANTDELLEAYTLLNTYLEEKKVEKKKEEKDEIVKGLPKRNEEDKPKKPLINLNNIKLYIAAIKDGAKNLSAKEKALSRTADTTFNMFMNNLQKAMVSDRRESIIKGSVIPSFSKSIKIAIGLAGLGLATGGPAVPLIAALGGFAISKNLTRKERALLLDDIVIEIQVLDKEISVAENNNNYKKMRELMKTKRELERQYARIQYNSRVGKDIIPSRSAD